VQIGWIQLVEFRSYRDLSWTPGSNLNILQGPNAQGKTNLLEALGMLVTGRSFRTSRLAEVPRWGADATVLAGELVRGAGPAAPRRTVRRTITKVEDGGWESAGEAVEWARVIAFGWQDLEIVHGAPGARRNFIDGLAMRLYPSHLATLLRYRRVLARRNHLLQGGGGPGAAAAARLEPWNEQLAAVGMELIDRRRRAVAALQTELARVYGAIAAPREKIEVRYRTAVGEASDQGALLAALARTRSAELRRGQTLVGPHRDDLAIEIDGIDVRVFGSRGQQRLVALALRLAEILPVAEASGTAPVLLLDDALSELDPRVRTEVLREIGGGDQVFLTTPEALAVAGAAVFHVNAGGVAAA